MVDPFALSLMEFFELVSMLALVIALIFTIRSFRKNARINEASFVKDMFEVFQRDRRAILDNPEALAVLAKERNMTPRELIKESIGSFDINRVYLLFHLHQLKLTSENQWPSSLQDIRVLFTDELVLAKWERVKSVYPEEFQRFIDQQILSSEMDLPQKPHNNEIKSSSFDT